MFWSGLHLLVTTVWMSFFSSFHRVNGVLSTEALVVKAKLDLSFIIDLMAASTGTLNTHTHTETHKHTHTAFKIYSLWAGCSPSFLCFPVRNFRLFSDLNLTEYEDWWRLAFTTLYGDSCRIKMIINVIKMSYLSHIWQNRLSLWLMNNYKKQHLTVLKSRWWLHLHFYSLTQH